MSFFPRPELYKRIWERVEPEVLVVPVDIMLPFRAQFFASGLSIGIVTIRPWSPFLVYEWILLGFALFGFALDFFTSCFLDCKEESLQTCTPPLLAFRFFCLLPFLVHQKRSASSSFSFPFGSFVPLRWDSSIKYVVKVTPTPPLSYSPLSLTLPFYAGSKPPKY